MGTYLSTPKTDKETEFGSGKDLAYGMSGMQGWRRSMEDAHLAALQFNGNDEMSMFGVFDGHGGAEVAKFCSKHLGEEFALLKKFQENDFEGALKEVFHRMDILLRDQKYASEIAQLRMGDETAEEKDGDDNDADGAMWQRIAQLKRLVIEKEGDGDAAAQVQAGCTAVVAFKHANTLYVANAGDSRGVLCRGGQAVSLSEDHKPAHETERSRIMAAGGFVSEIGGVPRVNGNLNLSRAIGDLKYKMNGNLPAEQQIITAQPDVRVFELTKEDRFFILACDGVWDVMSNQQAVTFVEEALNAGKEPHEVASAVIDNCLARDPKDACGIGCDNMTCIVITFKNYEKPS